MDYINNMLERENAFYTTHRTELREKYLDKWLVISGESLWGVYDTLKEAAQDALQHFEPGEFMMHKPADDGMVIEIGPNIHTRSPNDAETPEPVITISDGDLVTFPYV